VAQNPSDVRTGLKRLRMRVQEAGLRQIDLDIPMVILPSLQQLRFLCALAEQRHFGRAAESCAVTQSTLSGGIKDSRRGWASRFLSAAIAT
jgi:hypothetical protein